MRDSLAPLAERDFRLLFLGRTVSIVGNAFATTAIAFAVLDVTGSKADLGYVLAARALPQVVFLLAGGVWADRLPRHLVMVASNVVSGASQGVLAALLLGMRVPGSTFLAELGQGWREFISRAWLWGIVLQFSIVNAAETGSMNVLGPAVAKEHFGGAAGWGAVLAADAIGLVCGGVAMLRFRPRRMLLWATLFGAAVLITGATALVLLIRSVRTLERQT